MTVDTAKVYGRRSLRFNHLDDILAEAERLAALPTRQLSNWSLGQICQHLAGAMNLSIDGVPSDAPFRAPLAMRILSRFLKRRFLNKGMPPGFILPEGAPKALRPDNVAVGAALPILRAAIGRLAREADRHPHPLFGRLSRAEWDQLHLRHAELHLSFIHPETA